MRIAVPCPIRRSAIQPFPGFGCVVTSYARRQRLDRVLLPDFPACIRVGYSSGYAFAVNQESNAIAHLRDSSMRTEVPHGCRQGIFASVQKWREIVRLVAPVRQVAAAWTAADSLLIDIKDELIVSAYIDYEALRNFSEIEFLAKVQNRFVAFWCTRSCDPLSIPGI